MPDIAEGIWTTLSRFSPRSLIDIVIVAIVFYWLLSLLRHTTAMSLLRGLAILLIAGFILGNLFQLTVVNWLLRSSFTAILIAIPILFQPELRRALERIGRTGLGRWVTMSNPDRIISLITETALNLSEKRFGALLVLERETGLQDYIESGVELDASPSVDLLEGIFYPNSPLHDGAVILRGDRIIAARCTLPLSTNPYVSSRWGTRHRAAIGITEDTDAISIVVSEETGEISVAANGRIVQRLDESKLRRILISLYGMPPRQSLFEWRRQQV